jgi:hypothetical protein
MVTRRRFARQKVPRNITPARMFLNLKWNHFNSTSLVDSGFHNTYRLNSIYDPNYTATGSGEPNSQPTGYDQLAALYQKYKVHTAIIRVNYINDTQAATVVTFSAMDGNQRSTNMYEVSRRRNQFHTILQGSNSNGHANTTKSIKRKYYMRSILAKTKEQFRTSESVSADIGANPTDEVLLDIQQWLMSNPTSTSDQTFQYELKLIQFVEFFEPVYLATSE